MEKRYFPLFVDLSKKKVLVVGGGTIAARRVSSLLAFAGEITIVSPDVTETLFRLIQGMPAESGPLKMSREESECSESVLTWFPRVYEPGDETGMDLVLACTDSVELNCQITQNARADGIPANNCSDRNDCDFLFPGLSVRGSVTVGITAGGEDHNLVREIREKTDELLEELMRS